MKPSLFRAPPPMPVAWDAPPLPDGRIVTAADRGEHFVRWLPGRPGEPTVLLLHGWSATADLNWWTTFPALERDGLAVVAPDLLGHGRGPQRDAEFSFEAVADDLAALVATAGLGPVIAVGYSMGAAIACTLADRHPDAVTGIVVAGFGDRLRPLDRVLHPVHGRVLARSRRTGARRLNHLLVDRAVARRPDLERHRGWLVAELQRGNPRLLQGAARALARFDIARLAPLPVPSAAVVTTKDHLVPVARQQALAHALHAPVHRVEGDHDAPVLAAAFPDAILSAIREVEARRPVGV